MRHTHAWRHRVAKWPRLFLKCQPASLAVIHRSDCRTVAAAVEAALFFRIPSIAISLACSDEMDYRPAASIARRIFQTVLESDPPPGLCLNVNISAMPRACGSARWIPQRWIADSGEKPMLMVGMYSGSTAVIPS